MTLGHRAQPGQVRFTPRLDRMLERPCHERDVAGARDGRVRHHRVRTHFHRFGGLAWPADAGVDEIPAGDLETAKRYGQRVAEIAARLRG